MSSGTALKTSGTTSASTSFTTCKVVGCGTLVGSVLWSWALQPIRSDLSQPAEPHRSLSSVASADQPIRSVDQPEPADQPTPVVCSPAPALALFLPTCEDHSAQRVARSPVLVYQPPSFRTVRSHARRWGTYAAGLCLAQRLGGAPPCSGCRILRRATESLRQASKLKCTCSVSYLRT